MKIIIVGAGEMGRMLARSLCDFGCEVVIVDSRMDELEHIGDHLDVLRVEGSCTSIDVLKKAGIKSADALVALSGDEAANIIACQIASKMGVEKTICRLFRSDSISEKDGIGPQDFGIWKTFSTPEASVRKIMDVLDSQSILEKIRFGHQEACMSVVRLSNSSPLIGARIKDIPFGDLLKKIRIAALLHGDQFQIPHGDNVLGSGNKIYVSGSEASIKEFIEACSPGDSTAGRVVICGSGDVGILLAQKAAERGYDVRLIGNEAQLRKRIDEIPSEVLPLYGMPTDEDILEEAGVKQADAFVCTGEDDEKNILGCIIAKKLGVQKVITLTHKQEYIRIVSTMDSIDCGFSTSLISINTILRLLGRGSLRQDTYLQNYGASFSEFPVTEKSPLCGRKLKDCQMPATVMLALLFRGNDVLIPNGDTVLQNGDIAVMIAKIDAVKAISRLFPKD